MSAPISPSASSRTQCKIKMLCACWGSSAHKIVAGVMIYGVELVQFCLRENAERRFTVALAFHIPVVVSGLISQYGFAESIKPALFAIVAGDSFHLLTPFLWGMWWFCPFPPT